jgi:hypothetical protein
LAVDIGQLLHPAVNPTRFVGQYRGPFLLGRQFKESLKLLPKFGRAALFEGDHEVPVTLLAGRKDTATSIQAVQAQAEAQLREGGFERGGQAIESLEFAILLLFLVIGRGAARRIFDKLTGQGDRQTGRGQQLGFQDRMEIGDAARGVLLGQALGAMVVAETEIAGAIDGGNEITLKTEVVQGFHADESSSVLVAQQSEGGAANVSDEVIEGFGHRQAILLGARQVVEVVENGAFQVAQVIVGGTAASQAQAKEQQPPPAEKAGLIVDQRLQASVGQLVEPARLFGEEVADGFEEDPGQGYDLPR